MTDKVFLDTNILVYAFDRADPQKQKRACDILEGRVFDEPPTISTQVIQEFYVTVVRKLAVPLSPENALEVCTHLSQLPVVQVETSMVLAAIRLSQRQCLSFWDSLIIEAAKAGGCNLLVTEDLQAGADFDGLTIVNPFLG